MGERLGAREVSLEEEVLTIVARIKRKSKGSAAGELLVKIKQMAADEVREDLIKSGVMRSLLRCVKNNGSHAFSDTPSNLSSVSPQLLECILLCISSVETYEDDIRGMGKEMEEAVWEVMEEAQERGGGENERDTREIASVRRQFLQSSLCSRI